MCLLISILRHMSINSSIFLSRTRFLPKENITFYANHTASFLLPVNAIFEPTMSVGSEDDKMVVLNVAVAVSECHPTVR